MVADRRTSSQLIKKVAEIYDWLGLQMRKNPELSGGCSACGKCCDFKGFGHKLFVTTPELMYLAAKLGAENIRPMPTERCPYNIKGRCSVYEHRFSGCRIFSCKGDLDFQNELSEKALKKLKTICEQFLIPYRYTDLATALNNFASS
jgi:Fe-S-cluster containining protein